MLHINTEYEENAEILFLYLVVSIVTTRLWRVNYNIFASYQQPFSAGRVTSVFAE
jgi:hypothetical protein